MLRPFRLRVFQSSLCLGLRVRDARKVKAPPQAPRPFRVSVRCAARLELPAALLVEKALRDSQVT